MDALPPPPDAAPAPDLIVAQLDALRRLIIALHASAERAAMPPAVVFGLEALRDDCAGILADARIAAITHGLGAA